MPSTASMRGDAETPVLAVVLAAVRWLTRAMLARAAGVKLIVVLVLLLDEVASTPLMPFADKSSIAQARGAPML